jgi:hypothetical protein
MSNLWPYRICCITGLTEDQSARPISNIKVEMSEGTNRRVVSFAHDIMMSLVVRWKPPKRVGLVVLFKRLTGSAELVKVRKTLCRVGDIFLLCRVGDIFCHSKTASSLMWKISYVLFTLSCQLVKLMRNDSFCFVNQKTSSVISYHLQKTLCKNAYWDQISRQQFGNVPVSRCLVYHQQKNTDGW